MKKKAIIIIGVIVVIGIISAVAINLAKPSGDDIFISDVNDSNNDSTTNEQVGNKDEDVTGDNSGSDSSSSIYAETTVEDSLLGGWSTQSGDIYEFGNFGELTIFNSTTQEVKSSTYKTDGQTYVTIKSDGIELTYSINISIETNSLGDEIEVLVLSKDDNNIVLNKQYDIKKLSDMFN